MRCSLAKDVHLRWDETGRLLGGTLTSPLGRSIPVDAVAFLDLFTTERDLDETISDFLSRYAGAEGEPGFEVEVRRMASSLVEAGLLVPGDPGEAGPSPYSVQDYSFASPLAHVRMLRDRVRTDAFRTAVERAAPGRVVLDLGCGSGILSLFAARAGAEHVYAIEETGIIEVARSMAAANGLQDRITFLHGNSRDLRLPRQVDVLVSEIIGTEPLGEGIVPVLADAAWRFLRRDGVMIPRRLRIRAAGVHSEQLAAEDADIEAAVAGAAALEEAYGLTVGPLAEAHRAELESGRRRSSFVQPLALDGSCTDAVLTSAAEVADIDLTALHAGSMRPTERRHRLRAEAGGVINAVATWFEAELDGETVLSTSPHLALTPASWGGQVISAVPPVEVRAGAAVHLTATVDPAAQRGGIVYRLG